MGMIDIEGVCVCDDESARMIYFVRIEKWSMQKERDKNESVEFVCCFNSRQNVLEHRWIEYMVLMNSHHNRLPEDVE